MTNENIAKICHVAITQYNDIIGHTTIPWDDAKSSAIAGVKAFKRDTDISPRMMHDQWMDFKLKEGWVFGKIKSLENKTHPCLVDYSELLANDRIKNVLFLAIVKCLVEA